MGINELQIDKSSNTLLANFIPNNKGSNHIQFGFILPPKRSYTVQQSVKFDKDFIFGGKNITGKLGYGLGGGSYPSGGKLKTDGFSCRFIWRKHRSGDLHIALYVYKYDSKKWGDDFEIKNYIVKPGEWINLEMQVMLNSAINRSDGGLSASINGINGVKMTNMKFWSTGKKPSIDRLEFALFFGGDD